MSRVLTLVPPVVPDCAVLFQVGKSRPNVVKEVKENVFVFLLAIFCRLLLH